jgi:Ca-activated chloride channel family protein
MGDPAAPGSLDTKLDLAIEAASCALDDFKDTDEVGLAVFSTDLVGPNPNIREVVPVGPMSENRELIAEQLSAQMPTNGTPLYEATQTAYEDMLADYEPEAINAIVLLSDGQNDDGDPGDDDDQFAELVETLSAGSEGSQSRPVRVFTISYGDAADVLVLRTIAEATNAATYNSSNPANIEQVFTAVISNF